ncbi:MAG: hypothetical protein JW806_07885 [Sedimentisphaerales bacterium]|nr:hypothetical protein [Sedimentisphaerales bacterium]
MKKWIFFIVLVFPTIVFANPVIIFPSSDLRIVIVIAIAFMLEAMVTTIILFFCDMEVFPTLVALLIGNAGIYIAIFLPILRVIQSLVIAESIIFVVDGIYIKMISWIDALQMPDFKRLSWRAAFISAAIGNALSYYVGHIIANSSRFSSVY